MIKIKKYRNVFCLLSLFTFCYVTNSFAQCTNSCQQSACACTDASICLIGSAGATVTQDANNSCAFSITATTSRTTNSCGLGCFLAPSCVGNCYEYYLFYEATGATTFTQLVNTCGNSTSHTFTGLTGYGTYKVIMVYAYLFLCTQTYAECDLLSDIAIFDVTDNVCSTISALHSGNNPAYIQRSGEIIINCAIANNTLTSIQSDQDILFQNGAFLSGNSSPSTDVHAYIASCANYSREANQIPNGSDTNQNSNALDTNFVSISHIYKQNASDTNYFSKNHLYKGNYSGFTTSLNYNSVSFSIIPNPNNGNFTIHSDALENDAIIELYDAQSQKVYSTILPANTTFMNINNTTLQNGVYLYKLMGKNGSLNTGRLIIIN